MAEDGQERLAVKHWMKAQAHMRETAIADRLDLFLRRRAAYGEIRQ